MEARTTAWALSGAGSVYALIDAIEAALTGFPPTGCRNAYFTDERFGEQDSQGKVWLYDMTLNVVTVRLEAVAGICTRKPRAGNSQSATGWG